MRSHAKAPSAGSAWIAAASALAAALLVLVLGASSASAAVYFTATEPATEVQQGSAALNGYFGNDGQEAHYFFEWGETEAYGHTTPLPPGAATPGGGFQAVPPITISGLQAGTTYHYRLVVSDLDGNSPSGDATFTTAPAVTSLTADPAAAIKGSSAELNASFDGDGANATAYYFEWGLTTAYGDTTPAPPGTSLPASSGRVAVPPVAISGLKGGFTYHYRVVASNSLGKTFSTDASFKTAEAPLVENLNSRDIQATSAELTGEINPRHGDTTYRFEWGSSTSYGQVSPAPDGGVGSGNANVPVSTRLEGLTPGVTYHFRLVASNQYGTVSSADQTFGFRPASCPNAQLRQETRSNSLPDCRAYELVTPSFANGSVIYPGGGPTTPFATSPSRVAYAAGQIPFPEETGDPPNVQGDTYASTRTDTGWYQKYIGRSASETFLMGGPPKSHVEGWFLGYLGAITMGIGIQPSPSLDLIASYDRGRPATYEQHGFPSNSPYVWDTSTGKLAARYPTNVTQVPNGFDFVGVPQFSQDFSHFVFQSNIPFAPGGTAVSRTITCCDVYGQIGENTPPASIYDNDLKTGGVRLASIKGADEDETFQGFVLGTSDDGSRILMSEETPDPLVTYYYPGVHALNDVKGPFYLRVDGERTLEIAPGRQITYVGSTGDGKTVYLRSREQLTPDDHDSSTDLYVWHESDEKLTRVSVGDAGDTGDTDDCGGITWNGGKCDIEITNFYPYAYSFYSGQGGNAHSDSNIASKSGDIYFISPEQLLQGRGAEGQANLYLYRNGTLRFVASLDPQLAVCESGCGPVARMQVTPDGNQMAFAVRSKLTGYENAGRIQMYIYSPAHGRITCASCRPDGEPPTSDVFASMNGLFQTHDGRVFFATGEPLVARDTNGGEDIYEYSEGRAQLISSGTGTPLNLLFGGVTSTQSKTGLVSVSANGTDVYFAAGETLVTQDHNGATIKIYDARTGGGFPAERTPPNCTAADECHGSGTSPPVLPPDRTSANLGKKAKPKSHKAKKHKKKAQKKKSRKAQKSKAHKNNRKQGGSNHG